MTKPWPASPDELRRQYEAAVTEHGKPHAVAALAREYETTSGSARRRLERAGIDPSSRPQHPDGTELLRLYESLHDVDLPQKTIGKVAEVLGVASATAWRWLAEAGIIEVKREGPRGPRVPITGTCACGAPATAHYRGEEPPLCMPCYHKRRNKDRNHNPRNGRLAVAAFKADKPCADCGGVFPPCAMDLDHVPERGPKLFNLGNADANLKDVRAELAKCDLVCANCHRVRTWKRRQARKTESA